MNLYCNICTAIAWLLVVVAFMAVIELVL